jgi:hypothetical protein
MTWFTTIRNGTLPRSAAMALARWPRSMARW